MSSAIDVIGALRIKFIQIYSCTETYHVRKTLYMYWQDIMRYEPYSETINWNSFITPGSQLLKNGRIMLLT